MCVFFFGGVGRGRGRGGRLGLRDSGLVGFWCFSKGCFSGRPLGTCFVFSGFWAFVRR